MAALDLSEVRVLEDMVIDSIYNGLLSAKMDNKQQQLIVDYVSSRDFKAEDADELFAKLKKWHGHIAKVERIIENNLQETASNLRDNERRKERVKKEANKAYEVALKEMEAQRSKREQETMRDVIFQDDI